MDSFRLHPGFCRLGHACSSLMSFSYLILELQSITTKLSSFYFHFFPFSLGRLGASRHHGECPRRNISVGNSWCPCRGLHPEFHLRCQRRHPRSHFRPPIRRKGRCFQRGHTFSHSVVAESNHLRCADETTKHIDHNGKQGFADGELDVESAASTRGEDVAKDLSGMLIIVFCTDCATRKQTKHDHRTSVKTTMNVSFHPSVTKSSKP